jgi:hypothetical protein
MSDFNSIFMFVVLLCTMIIFVCATIMMVYLLLSHGKDVYDEFKRSGKWLK